jgi:hypothetical protein
MNTFLTDTTAVATQIAALEARIGHHDGDTSNDPHQHHNDWRSGWDADRIADADENRRWRQCP